MKTISVSIFKFRMLIMKRLITTGLFLLPLLFQAQEKKWPTLLWEISGNGLDKPSYLYGTMHVSSKLAFHLGDPFFDALESVDVVALELHHEKWLAEELSEDNLLKMNAMYHSSGFETFGNFEDEYRFLFSYGLDRKDYLLSPFRFFPRYANYIVSRNRRESAEYEEDSWLDYFIYKGGKKLKKEIFGLETFKESQYAMDLATRYNQDHRDELEEQDYDWGGDNSLYEELESAYRKGDLDLLDSLSNITSVGGWKKYILEYRNEVFVGRIDSILKLKTMFIGMGAAHLPGETGVIEMLRDLGYTLKPIKPGRRNPKKIEALEAKEYANTFTKYTSASGLFEIDVPGPVFQAPVSSEMFVETSSDLPNATSLFMIRCKTYAGLRKQKPQDIIRSLDSLLYENVPGSIESQKEIVVNGYPAFDILSKDRLGHYHRYRIISMDQELLVIRLDGHQKLAASRYGERIFNSFKFLQTPAEDWKELTVSDKTLSLNLPSSALYFSMEFLQGINNSLGISAHDKKSDAFIQVSRVGIPTSRLEPDHYEISEVEYSYRKARDLRLIKRDTIEFLDYPTFDCNYKTKEGSQVKVRYTLVGTLCYVFAVHNPTDEVLNKLYSSIRFSKPSYRKNFTNQTDSTLMARFEIPYKLPKVNEELNWYSGEDDDKNPFGAQSSEASYSPLEGGETIEVKYEVMGKYQLSVDSIYFEKFILGNWTNGGEYKIAKKEVQKLDSTMVYDVWVGDTAIQRIQWIKAIYRPSSSYVLKTTYDSLAGPSQFIEKFYNSFTPFDTTHIGNRFQNRTNYFVEDITSNDSLTYKRAFDLVDYLYLRFDTSTTIFSLMDNISKWSTAEERRIIQFELMQDLIYFKDPTVLDYLTDKYKSWADSTENQAFALELISDIETKEAVQRTRDLLVESAPLGIEYMDVIRIFRNLRDSMELSAGITQSLFPLLEIDEYESGLYRHIAVLLDSGMISKKDYAPLFTTILNKAKVDYRRANSTRNRLGETNGNDYEQWNSGKYRTNNNEANAMRDLWRLLLPYKDQKEVRDFFSSVERTKHKDILLSLVSTYYSNEIPVSEALLDTLCSTTQGKIDLYEVLEGLKLDSLYPDKHKDQDAILEHVVKQRKAYYNSGELDSLVFLRCEPIQFRNRKGELYFYKIRGEEKGDWKLCCAGIIPSDHSSIVITPDFVETGRGKFDQDKMTPEEQEDAFEELQRMAIRQLVNSQHRNPYSWMYNNYDN